MIGDFLFVRFGGLDPAFPDELMYELSEMGDFELPSERWVLLDEGMVAVWRGDNDLLHSMLLESVYIGLSQTGEKIFLSQFANTLAAAALFGTQDAKVDPCLLENIDGGDSYSSRFSVIRGSTARKVENLCPVAWTQGLHAEILCPIGPFLSSFTPGVSHVLAIGHDGSEGFGEGTELGPNPAGGSKDVDDLNTPGTAFDTGAAGRAEPNILRAQFDEQTDLCLMDQSPNEKTSDQIPWAGGGTASALVAGFECISSGFNDRLSRFSKGIDGRHRF
jgi:hypothetical protein